MTGLASLGTMANGELDFRLLGTMEVRQKGAELALGGAKQRALLAILLINANRVVTTDELVESLWPEKAPGKPLTAIQGYVSALRRTLDPDEPFAVIVTEPAGYRLPVEPGALDTARFEDLVRQGRAALDGGQPRRAVDAFTEGLALFRGPPLADFMYDSWATTEKARLDELRLVCVEDRIEGELQLGRHAELIGELESLVSENPLREGLRGHLMLALYRSGRQAEALEAYQDARRILVDELGIEPSTAIKELHAQILNQDALLSAPEREPIVQATVELPRGSHNIRWPNAGDGGGRCSAQRRCSWSPSRALAGLERLAWVSRWLESFSSVPRRRLLGTAREPART